MRQTPLVQGAATPAEPGVAAGGRRPLREWASSGFALITVLWLIATLSSLVLVGLAATRLGHQAGGNRMLLTRARWAADACAAIAQARWTQQEFPDTATIDLGRGTRCRWRTQDPTARINVNAADPGVLRRLVGDSVANELLSLRQRAPFVSDSQLHSLRSVLTVEGPGTVNANEASAEVLLALAGLDQEAVDRLATARSANRAITSLDGLVGELSPSARAVALQHYPDLARSLTFSAPQLLLTIEGWSLEPQTLTAIIELLVVPAQGRLAVIRRRMRG